MFMIIRYKWIARHEVQKNDAVVAKMIRNAPALQASLTLLTVGSAANHTPRMFETAARKSARKTKNVLQ